MPLTWSIIIALAIISPFYALWARAGCVAKYRDRIFDEILMLQLTDILERHPDRQWREDAFNTVSFRKMLFKFWRRLDSFYPDKSFLDPEAAGPQQSKQ